MSIDQMVTHLAHLLVFFASGFFGIFCVVIGAWINGRMERKRRQSDRRLQVFDEACRVTAHWAALISNSRMPGLQTPEELIVSVMALDRKIDVSFSAGAYSIWKKCEVHFAWSPLEDESATFSTDRTAALRALAKELY
jgi:hypothetical protein